jgi:thiol:disulfide interchange protein DsbA
MLSDRIPQKSLSKSRFFSFAIAIVCLFLLSPFSTAQPAGFDAAGKYERIQPPQPTSSPGKVEVIEVFWYGCPHCFDFEPLLSKWVSQKPQYVDFQRLPAIFRKGWEPHARAYYTAELLGVVEKIHQPLFEAMHMHSKKVATQKELMEFFAQHGVSKERFLETYDSFAVDSRVQRGKVMQQRYGITGVPAMVVNGKYRTSGSEAGSLENVLRVVDYLIAQERQATDANAGNGNTSPFSPP